MRRLGRSLVSVLFVLLFASVVVNAEVIRVDQRQSSQIKYAESYGMDHVVANIQSADAFMTKNKAYLATQIAEAAGELVTLSKIIPSSRSNTNNYAWEIGFYLHAHSTDILSNGSGADAMVNYIKEADIVLSAHTKNGHYDISYLANDIVSIGEKTPSH